MPSLEVRPRALPTSADEVLAFASAVEQGLQIAALPGELGVALEEYVRGWSRAELGLASRARRHTAAVRAAAELYGQLELLLIRGGR